MRICCDIEGLKIKRSFNLRYLQCFRISKPRFRLYTTFIKLCSHYLDQGNINHLKNLQTTLLNSIIKIQDSCTQVLSELLRKRKCIFKKLQQSRNMRPDCASSYVSSLLFFSLPCPHTLRHGVRYLLSFVR
jgi:hypothetical protein